MREILLEELKRGIGTLAPTRSLGLDFVPLVRERYDLLTTEEAFYHRPPNRQPRWLRCDAARRRGRLVGPPKDPDAAVAVPKEVVTLGVREAGGLPSTRSRPSRRPSLVLDSTETLPACEYAMGLPH